MYLLTLQLYTLQECFDQAIPLRILPRAGRIRLHREIPKAPGIYLLLDYKAVRYVGQTRQTIAQRVRAYRYDPRLVWITWHLVDTALLDVYEAAYIDTLHPDLNGEYPHKHMGRKPKWLVRTVPMETTTALTTSANIRLARALRHSTNDPMVARIP